MTADLILLAMCAWPLEMKCGPVIGSPEWINHCGGNTMGTLQEQALAGTMREEFEAHMAGVPTGQASSESPAWSSWQAAYAAGQRADTDLLKQSLQALEHALNWLDPQSSAALEAQGVVEGLAEAIRNRKEQG